MTNILQGFDPSILQARTQRDPFGSFMRGQEMGLGAKQKRMKIKEGEERSIQNKALMGLDLSDPEFMQNAMAASPEIAMELIKARLKKELAANKQYQPDNEWVDDPKDPNFQVYMQVKQDPQTNAPTSVAVPGMRRHKQYLDRLEQKKDEFTQFLAFKKSEAARHGKEFNLSNLMDDKKLQVQYAKLKNENLKAQLEQAKTQWMFDSAQADAVIEYDKMKLKAVDAIDTIDRMIGNEARGVKRHAGFEATVGRKGGSLLFGLKSTPFDATESTNFMALYNKVTGQAFMTAFEGLKGGGQITEMEGEKATQALLEMNTSTDEKTFIDAARRFQKYIKAGMANAEKEKKLKTPRTLRKTKASSVPTDAELNNMSDAELKAYSEGQ